MIAKPARVKTGPAQHSLRVEPIEGELGLRFWVESESDPETSHLVDISLNGGIGSCSCASYRCRNANAVELALLEKKPLSSCIGRKEYTCKHIRAVHNYWLCHALPAVIAAHKQQ